MNVTVTTSEGRTHTFKEAYPLRGLARLIHAERRRVYGPYSVSVAMAADYANLDRSHWHRLESGKVQPLFSTLLRVAKALKLRIVIDGGSAGT